MFYDNASKKNGPTAKILSQDVLSKKKDLFKELNILESDPLIDGFWVIDRPLVQEGGVIFNCSTCFSYFEDRISYELHMQGLKHKENKKQCPSSNEKRLGQSLKHFTKLETLLHESTDPLLGVNYLTEFLHTNARYDCVCNLCGTSYQSTQEAHSHIKSSNHMLNFIKQHDKVLYSKLQSLKFDNHHVIDGAKKLEYFMNERNKRTKIMEELGNVWVEYQHDDTCNYSDLKGHQLNGSYEAYPSVQTSDVDLRPNKVEQVFGEVEKLFVLSNDLPPNYCIKNFNRTTFLELLGRMVITSNNDADLCLRLTNSLTLSLLNYRMALIDRLKTVDASELKEKAKTLFSDAMDISMKLMQRQSIVS